MTNRSSAGQTWQRMGGVAGTIAEGKFEELYPHKWLRMGFDRPDWSDDTSVGYHLPKVLTAMPDYLARNGEGPYWVECIGCKGNIVRSMKTHKYELLLEWQDFIGLPVYVFIWNSSKKRWLSIHVNDIPIDEAPVKEFHDGPTYYELDWADLEEAAKWIGKG